MTEHPHAWFLRAIADGEPLGNFEAKCCFFDNFVALRPFYIGRIAESPRDWQVHRKPRMVKIGDTEVQAGITEAPLHGTSIWIADSTVDAYAWESIWDDHSDGKMRIQRGLIHLTREPAVAMGKALAALTEHKNG